MHFICGGVERISRNARASVRIAKEGHHWVRGRLGPRKDLRTIGRRWQPRSASTSQPIHFASQFSHYAVVDKFDYGFAENGLTAYKLGKQLPSQSFIKHIGEDRYKPLVNFILHYIADLDIPIKRYGISTESFSLGGSFAVARGTFVEFRNGMVNVSPIGRNAT